MNNDRKLNKKEEFFNKRNYCPSLTNCKFRKYLLSREVINLIPYHSKVRENFPNKWWSMKELIQLWKVSHPWWKKGL